MRISIHSLNHHSNYSGNCLVFVLFSDIYFRAVSPMRYSKFEMIKMNKTNRLASSSNQKKQSPSCPKMARQSFRQCVLMRHAKYRSPYVIEQQSSGSCPMLSCPVCQRQSLRRRFFCGRFHYRNLLSPSLPGENATVFVMQFLSERQRCRIGWISALPAVPSRISTVRNSTKSGLCNLAAHRFRRVEFWRVHARSGTASWTFNAPATTSDANSLWCFSH